MTWRDLPGLFAEAAREWLADNAARIGAALAFYATFAAAPLLIICTAVAGMIFGEEAARGELLRQLTELVGKDAAQFLQSTLASASQPRTTLWATIAGVAVMAVGAAGLFGELQGALNAIWNVQTRTGRGWMGFVADRFLSFAMVLGTALLLLASLVVTTTLSTVSAQFEHSPLTAWAIIINPFLSFVLITILFAMMYRYLPDAVIAWSDVWLGAFVTSILFNVGKYAIGVYLAHSAVSSAYGAAGSLAALLIWLYYAAQVFLYGAELTQVYAKKFGSGIIPAENAVRVHEKPVPEVN